MDIHIGDEIRKVIREQKNPIGPLAEKLNLHIGSISRIYSMPSIQVSQLKEVSIYLKYDFFEIYSQDLNLKKVVVVTSECEKLLAEKTAEVEALKKEMGYLKEINDLLRKKK